MLAPHSRLMLKIVGSLTVVLILMMGVPMAPPRRLAPPVLPPAALPTMQAPVVAAMPAPADEVSAPLAPSVMSPPPAISASQAAVAQWIGTKYHVAPEAIAPLVVEADHLSAKYHLSPQLLIAVMAIESSFHPYIQSEAGAQGLMQVMPTVHAKRYEKFGGKGASVDPIVSLKVGADILHDYVKLHGGSETEALRYYLGGGASSERYIEKVRAEQHRLMQAAAMTRPDGDHAN